MRLRDEESEPLDYAAELGSRPPARLVLANRQTEGAGVSPGGPVAEGMRTDTQAETLDGTAGLIVPLPTGRDLDEHSHGEGIARQGEQLDRCRHRLQVDYLGPAGNDHQVGSPGGLQRGRFRPRRRIENNGGHAPCASRIEGRPEPRRRDVGDDGERGLPARRLGSTAASSMTRHWPPTSPSCTTPAAHPRAPRWRSPRPASARSWPVSRIRLENGPPGYSPAAGGPPPTAAAARRAPFSASDLAAVLATCHRSRRRERVLIRVRLSKTNQEGEVNDVRFVKDGVARALRTLRATTSPEPGDHVVPLSAQMIGLRFTAAAAQAAGVESRMTAHSGRVGLASELTSRSAATTDVMLAGNWKTSRMVAHYSARATAERGAVARYL